MSGRRYKPLVCPGNTWGWAFDATGTLEVRCADRFCRTAEGHAVIHAFDLQSGDYKTRPDGQKQTTIALKEPTNARNTTL